MRINKKVVLSVAMVGMLSASPLYAQFFNNNVSAQRTEEQAQQRVAPVANQQYAKPTHQQQPAPAQQPVQQYQQQGYNSAYGTQQQVYTAQQRQQQPKAQPTPVNYNRGGLVEYKIADNKSNDKDTELIMLYMKDFKVYRSPSGQTRCSMIFAIATTLKDKISNISYRLKWPKMETVLSFSDVPPHVENNFNYTLLGDGCYSMDRTPNIIINRCRAKGLSQRTCASKVRWITRAS
ncbi:MAG: hypothetical protein IJZ59_06270 [Alphaproteobacteria bacterium]|nr:hypothetical protein [Alphaproteobacteria bacterium]